MLISMPFISSLCNRGYRSYGYDGYSYAMAHIEFPKCACGDLGCPFLRSICPLATYILQHISSANAYTKSYIVCSSLSYRAKVSRGILTSF